MEYGPAITSTLKYDVSVAYPKHRKSGRNMDIYKTPVWCITVVVVAHYFHPEHESSFIN